MGIKGFKKKSNRVQEYLRRYYYYYVNIAYGGIQNNTFQCYLPRDAPEVNRRPSPMYFT